MNEDDIKKIKGINTKLITPLIVLSGTAIIAIFTYFEHYPVGDWFIIVFACVVVFMIIGLIIERMLNSFIDINYEKIMAERAEQERLEEEARAAMEAEGGDESNPVEGESVSSEF